MTGLTFCHAVVFLPRWCCDFKVVLESSGNGGCTVVRCKIHFVQASLGFRIEFVHRLLSHLTCLVQFKKALVHLSIWFVWEMPVKLWWRPNNQNLTTLHYIKAISANTEHVYVHQHIMFGIVPAQSKSEKESRPTLCIFAVLQFAVVI